MNASKILKTVHVANRIPGDTRETLAKHAIDMDGRHWPSGSVFQPQSMGFDNVFGAPVQTVIFVPGGLARFTGP